MSMLLRPHLQDNYPETLGHVAIINAPVAFRVMWAFAKGFLDARTLAKIEVQYAHACRG